MLCPRLPGEAAEVGVLELLPDLVQEIPARGELSEVVAGREASVTAGVELANDASFALLGVPDQGARISLGAEGLGILEPRVVDSEFDGLDADFVKSE